MTNAPVWASFRDAETATRRHASQPGDILSIVVRTHEGRPIFATDDDRQFFVACLRCVFFVPTDAGLVAWALLLDHFHLAIRVRSAAPGTVFLRPHTVTAQRGRRRRGGHRVTTSG